MVYQQKWKALKLVEWTTNLILFLTISMRCKCHCLYQNLFCNVYKNFEMLVMRRKYFTAFITKPATKNGIWSYQNNVNIPLERIFIYEVLDITDTAKYFHYIYRILGCRYHMASCHRLSTKFIVEQDLWQITYDVFLGIFFLINIVQTLCKARVN